MVSDLIEDAKENSKKYSYGSSGSYVVSNIAQAMLWQATRVDSLRVPYDLVAQAPSNAVAHQNTETLGYLGV